MDVGPLQDSQLDSDFSWEICFSTNYIVILLGNSITYSQEIFWLIFPKGYLHPLYPNQSQNCKFCSATVNADLLHCFFYCEKTKLVGRWLLSWMSKQDSGVSAAGLLKLEFQVEESREMPVVWLIAQTLLYMWGVRANGNTVDLNTTRSVLEGRINLLRHTRFRNDYQLLKEIIEI